MTTVTTLNEACNRVAMNAVRQELLHAQTEAAGLNRFTIQFEDRMLTI